MSASLVGSEMCIRDSSRALRSSPELAGALRSPSGLCYAARQSSQTGMAVSYTHLTLPTICSV
eukprot:11438008-Alexandrium_andersonii.AAC.1